MDSVVDPQTAVMQNGNSDEITRAITRNGAWPGSPLEGHIRARAYDIWYGWLGVGPNRDLRMDTYIREQKGTPAFAGSFMQDRPAARIAMTDQAALFGADIDKIASGEIEVYDPRERPPR